MVKYNYSRCQAIDLSWECTVEKSPDHGIEMVKYYYPRCQAIDMSWKCGYMETSSIRVPMSTRRVMAELP